MSLLPPPQLPPPQLLLCAGEEIPEDVTLNNVGVVPSIFTTLSSSSIIQNTTTHDYLHCGSINIPIRSGGGGGAGEIFALLENMAEQEALSSRQVYYLMYCLDRLRLLTSYEIAQRVVPDIGDGK